MNNIDCNIIRDLLPTYIDGLTSEESNQMIEEHLNSCEECRQLADALGSDVKFSGERANHEIDYLKKVRSKLTNLMIITIGVCVLVFTALLAIGIKTYIIGSPVAFHEIISPQDGYGGIGTKFNPETNELTIYGELMNGLALSGVKIELDKTIGSAYDVTVYGAPRPFSDKQHNSRFKEVIKIPDDNEIWSVYSMGSSPHDMVMFWWNADILKEKYAQPLSKLTEYLTSSGKLSPQDSRLDYSYFDEVLGEPCYVFYLIKNVGGVEDISSIRDYAVSENGECFYEYSYDLEKWEPLP